MKSPILVFLTVLLSSFLWNTNLVLAMDDDEKAAVAKSISGKIESCSGWSLNKLPQLKKFLKLGHAESYQNVEIEYIHGKKATLTIYHDDEKVETLVLSDLQNHEEMHALFVEKGFQLKPENEIEAIKAERYAEHGKQIEIMEERARKRKTGVREKKPERKSKSNKRIFNREEVKPLSDEEKAELRKKQEEYRQARKLEREQRRQNIKEGKSDDKEFFLKERRRKEREERRARGADQKAHGELNGELKEKMIQKFRTKIGKMKLGNKERVGTDEL